MQKPTSVPSLVVIHRAQAAIAKLKTRCLEVKRDGLLIRDIQVEISKFDLCRRELVRTENNSRVCLEAPTSHRGFAPVIAQNHRMSIVRTTSEAEMIGPHFNKDTICVAAPGF
jgi:hypothetical protein